MQIPPTPLSWHREIADLPGQPARLRPAQRFEQCQPFVPGAETRFDVDVADVAQAQEAAAPAPRPSAAGAGARRG